MIVESKTLQESRLSLGQFQRLTAAGIVSVNPDVVSEAVVFTGTRVPFYNL